LQAFLPPKGEDYEMFLILSCIVGNLLIPPRRFIDPTITSLS
jgi:hypothetical protein